MSGHLGNLVLPQHIGYFLNILSTSSTYGDENSHSKIYRFGMFLKKGILILKDKGVKTGELQVTLMYTY